MPFRRRGTILRCFAVVETVDYCVRYSEELVAVGDVTIVEVEVDDEVDGIVVAGEIAARLDSDVVQPAG
ncbi:hypothetical protein TNCV_447161 [Trichonephila clavipes]|nr:hypothetical protein TNCV_447161 [Trichonephila clavipes]